MRKLAAGGEGERGLRGQAEQILQPGAGDLLDDRGRRATGIQRGVLIPGGGEPIRCQRRGQRSAH